MPVAKRTGTEKDGDGRSIARSMAKAGMAAIVRAGVAAIMRAIVAPIMRAVMRARAVMGTVAMG
jgi:hypothetical protein